MNIDKSYLSRIIKSHEKSGYIIRKASATDLRSFELYLTLQGESAVKEFIRKSNQEIAEIMMDVLSSATTCPDFLFTGAPIPKL